MTHVFIHNCVFSYLNQEYAFINLELVFIKLDYNSGTIFLKNKRE